VSHIPGVVKAMDGDTSRRWSLLDNNLLDSFYRCLPICYTLVPPAIAGGTVSKADMRIEQETAQAAVTDDRDSAGDKV
jgi:hypothetical protein